MAKDIYYQGRIYVGQWVPLKGYEDCYEICPKGIRNKLTKELLSCRLSPKGYVVVHLGKYKKQRGFRFHRLLAIQFIPNPLNKPQVNHKNGIKDDNRLKNIEWATAKENTQHAIKTKLRVQRGNNLPAICKPVYQCTKAGHIIQLFPSAAEAQRVTKINQNQISRCANGGVRNKGKTKFKRINTTGGFRWIYVKKYKLKNTA